MPSDAVRAFIALELDEGLRQRLAELQAQLKPRLGDIRMARPEGIHLTLRFLGQASPAQVEQIRKALEPAAAACPPMDAPVRGIGMFPERGSPRVLWVDIGIAPPIERLQKVCEAAARKAGFDPEERAFRAHLTLGRWRERAPRPELPQVDLGTTRLETLVLFRSELRPGGSVYTPLARFALRGGGQQ